MIIVEEAVERDIGFVRIAQGDDIARTGRKPLIFAVRLEPARGRLLLDVHIEIDQPGSILPRRHAADIVKVHVAAGAQLVEHLLGHGRAALGPWRDEDVARLLLVRPVMLGIELLERHQIDDHFVDVAGAPPKSCCHAQSPSCFDRND